MEYACAASRQSLGDVLVRLLSHPRLHPSHLCGLLPSVKDMAIARRRTAADAARREGDPNFLHFGTRCLDAPTSSLIAFWAGTTYHPRMRKLAVCRVVIADFVIRSASTITGRHVLVSDHLRALLHSHCASRAHGRPVFNLLASLTRALLLTKAFAGYPGRSLSLSFTVVTPQVHVAYDGVNRLHLSKIIRSCHLPA